MNLIGHIVVGNLAHVNPVCARSGNWQPSGVTLKSLPNEEYQGTIQPLNGKFLAIGARETSAEEVLVVRAP